MKFCSHRSLARSQFVLNDLIRCLALKWIPIVYTHCWCQRRITYLFCWRLRQASLLARDAIRYVWEQMLSEENKFLTEKFITFSSNVLLVNNNNKNKQVLGLLKVFHLSFGAVAAWKNTILIVFDHFVFVRFIFLNTYTLRVQITFLEFIKCLAPTYKSTEERNTEKETQKPMPFAIFFQFIYQDPKTMLFGFAPSREHHRFYLSPRLCILLLGYCNNLLRNLLPFVLSNALGRAFHLHTLARTTYNYCLQANKLESYFDMRRNISYASLLHEDARKMAKNIILQMYFQVARRWWRA